MTKKETTRDKIMSSMYKLLAIHGYEKTALSMIADELGIKKASIYYHFKSKEDILLAVFDEMFSIQREKYEKIEITKENFESMLIEFGHDLVDGYSDDESLAPVTLEFYIQSIRNKAIEKRIIELDIVFRAHIISYLSKGREFGILDEKFDIELSTSLLFTVIQGMEMSIISGSYQNNKKVWEMAVSCLLDKHRNISF